MFVNQKNLMIIFVINVCQFNYIVNCIINLEEDDVVLATPIGVTMIHIQFSMRKMISYASQVMFVFVLSDVNKVKEKTY